MFTRIFRAHIRADLKDEFEKKFLEISVPLVMRQTGFLSHTVGYPTKWNPNHYLLTTNWKDEASLVRFAGEDWREAVIPKGMERFIIDCWVDHFWVEGDGTGLVRPTSDD